MTSKTRLVAGALALALLAPVASTNAADPATPGPELIFTVGYVQSNLIKGKTTRAEVIAAFGNPTHQKVRATDSGSTEVLYYQKGAQPASGGGVAKTTRGIGSIAGGLARMFGNNNTAYQAARVSSQANDIASGMEMLTGSAGGSQAAAASGPSVLTIQLQDGVVASYSLE